MPERRVLRQLAEALLFERIAAWSPQELARGAESELAFTLGPTHYTCRARQSAFGRVRVTEGSVRRLRADGPVHWSSLVNDLPAEEAVRSAVLQELENTVRFCRWNAQNLALSQHSRREQSYEELESSLHEGHPYHPCFKARTGFSVDDHRLYGPEAGNSFPLSWLAVRRAALRQNLPTAEPAFWISELGQAAWNRLTGALASAGLSPEGYGFLPAHPWQWTRLRQRPDTQRALAKRELVDLELELGEYSATQSVRTLQGSKAAARAHVKLPLAVRISSAERSLERETVSAAPALSAWLRDLVASDPFLAEERPLVILAEYAGASYDPGEPGAGLDGKLAMIWRQSVRQHLLPGESAAPFNALLACEADGRPFVHPWLARYGRARWVARLLEVCVLPVWRLLVAHGVAVEAHAQNMILIHRDGWPVRLALRDFHDSVEYVTSYLADPKRLPDFTLVDPRFRGAPIDRYYAMSSVEELRQLFMDTVFVFNLSELSYLLEAHYGFLEKQFWHLAHRALLSHDRSSWGNTSRASALGVTAPAVRTESLFRRRLRTGWRETCNHFIPNPLSDFA